LGEFQTLALLRINEAGLLDQIDREHRADPDKLLDHLRAVQLGPAAARPPIDKMVAATHAVMEWRAAFHAPAEGEAA
jgi:hypothetical protein